MLLIELLDHGGADDGFGLDPAGRRRQRSRAIGEVELEPVPRHAVAVPVENDGSLGRPPARLRIVEHGVGLDPRTVADDVDVSGEAHESALRRPRLAEAHRAVRRDSQAAGTGGSRGTRGSLRGGCPPHRRAGAPGAAALDEPGCVIPVAARGGARDRGERKDDREDLQEDRRPDRQQHRRDVRRDTWLPPCPRSP